MEFDTCVLFSSPNSVYLTEGIVCHDGNKLFAIETASYDTWYTGKCFPVPLRKTHEFFVVYRVHS